MFPISILEIDGKDEVIASNEDLFLLIREKLGDKVAELLQLVMDETEHCCDRNCDIDNYEQTLSKQSIAANEIADETKKLLPLLTAQRLNRKMMMYHVVQIQNLLKNNFDTNL